MKVKITFDLDEWARRAINSRYGEDSPADYDTVKQFINSTIDGELESLAHEQELREDQA